MNYLLFLSGRIRSNHRTFIFDHALHWGYPFLIKVWYSKENLDADRHGQTIRVYWNWESKEEHELQYFTATVRCSFQYTGKKHAYQPLNISHWIRIRDFVSSIFDNGRRFYASQSESNDAATRAVVRGTVVYKLTTRKRKIIKTFE